MSGRIEHDPDTVVRLDVRDVGPESDDLGHSLVEIAHLDVEVHHRAPGVARGRPDRRHVALCLLEDDVDRALRRVRMAVPGSSCPIGQSSSAE